MKKEWGDELRRDIQVTHSNEEAINAIKRNIAKREGIDEKSLRIERIVTVLICPFSVYTILVQTIPSAVFKDYVNKYMANLDYNDPVEVKKRIGDFIFKVTESARDIIAVDRYEVKVIAEIWVIKKEYWCIGAVLNFDYGTLDIQDIDLEDREFSSN